MKKTCLVSLISRDQPRGWDLRRLAQQKRGAKRLSVLLGRLESATAHSVTRAWSTYFIEAISHVGKLVVLCKNCTSKSRSKS